MGVLIPNKYFYIWSGNSFPYLNLLAVKSLLLAETKATVVVFIVGPEPQNENFENLRVLERVSIVSIEPENIFSQLPSDIKGVGTIFHKIPESSASARSNILRYALLYLHGGVYLDFDTVVTRSLSDLAGHQCFIGEENVWVGDEDRVAGKWWVCLYPRNLFWLTSWLLRRADSAWFSGKLHIARALEKTDAIWSKKQPNNAVMGAVAQSPFVRELLLECLPMLAVELNSVVHPYQLRCHLTLTCCTTGRGFGSFSAETKGTNTAKAQVCASQYLRRQHENLPSQFTPHSSFRV